MKKAIFIFIFLSMFLVSELEAARLFEYRGKFSAKRSSDEKVSNYVLLKQGSNVEFSLVTEGTFTESIVFIDKSIFIVPSMFTLL